MITLTETQIDDALTRLEKGLRKYCWIQDNLHRAGVDQDKEFQTRFNDFYKVRRNAGWRACYFTLLEHGKTQPVCSFPMILGALREQTGQIEASFASKLIATLDPSQPVIDKFVLTNFGLSLPAQYAKDRESKTATVYQCLCRLYEELLSLPVAQTVRRKFTQAYPWADISNLKMLDLVLWQTRS